VEPTSNNEKTPGMTLLTRIDELRQALEEVYSAFDALFAFVIRLKNERQSQASSMGPTQGN
jgi:hypothetical protein